MALVQSGNSNERWGQRSLQTYSPFPGDHSKQGLSDVSGHKRLGVRKEKEPRLLVQFA